MVGKFARQVATVRIEQVCRKAAVKKIGREYRVEFPRGMARRKHAPQHALDVDAHKRTLGEDVPDERRGKLDRRLGKPRTIREDDGGFLRKERLLDGLVKRNGNSTPRLHRRLDERLGILGDVIA